MATITSKNICVSIDSVQNFHKLSIDDAEKVLYETVIPKCEEKGVKLSDYGNHAGSGSLCNIAEYSERKENKDLFSIKRVQQAFKELDSIITSAPDHDYLLNSYGLKHTIERVQSSYITNGDTIVALLLKGHSAVFGTFTISQKVRQIIENRKSFNDDRTFVVKLLHGYNQSFGESTYNVNAFFLVKVLK